MSTSIPIVISESNLSHAWARAFLEVFDRSKKSLHPFCITLDGFADDEPMETPEIRRALDKSLSNHSRHKCSIAISASTIFPVRGSYKVNSRSRKAIYKWYTEKMLPRLKKRDSRNQYGTYFERMIAFEGTKHTSTGTEIKQVNQLEHIIEDWSRPRTRSKRPRHSALQVSCFDPPKDHTGQSVRGFPCLQQVSFGYDDEKGLSISAYYPTQYIYDRAYGNYLGLCQLGTFMARSLELSLSRLNCFVAHPELGDTTKEEVRDVADLARNHLEVREENDSNADGTEE